GAPPFPLRSAATRSLRLLVREDASLLQDGDYQEEEAGDRDHGVDQYQPDGEQLALPLVAEEQHRAAGGRDQQEDQRPERRGGGGGGQHGVGQQRDAGDREAAVAHGQPHRRVAVAGEADPGHRQAAQGGQQEQDAGGLQERLGFHGAIPRMDWPDVIPEPVRAR